MNEAGTGELKAQELTGLPAILQSRFIVRLLLTFLLIAGLLTATDLAFPSFFREKALFDFDAFYVVGNMAWRGDIADAYHYKTMFEAQEEMFGTMNFLPWTYPPPFNLVVAALAPLPEWLSYLSFVVITFLGFVHVLRRIEPGHFAFCLISTFPTLLITTTCGQNGFLTAFLIGSVALLFLENRRTAGIPLGLLVIKPHLAVGVALLPVLNSRAGTIAISTSTITISAAAATLLLGIDIWPAFLNGVKESGEFLEAGLYHLVRMTSVYATVVLISKNSTIAFIAQGTVAVGAIGMLVYGYRVRIESRRLVGIGVLCSLLISPYLYDYDLPILTIALALLARDVETSASRFEQFLLVLLCWLSCGSGMLITALESGSSATRVILSSYVAGYSEMTTLAGASLLAAAIILTGITLRAQASTREFSVS